jgi:lipooligosaccharide transport system permease protein
MKAISTAPFRLVERNVMTWRRHWWVIASGAFEPLFYLLGLGFGMGALVGAIEVGGTEIAYKNYVAPGLMASAAMNGAVFDTTFNFFFKLKHERVYDAMLNTPITLTDIVVGELGWSIFRGAIYAVFFLIAMAALGLTSSWWVLLTVPAAILISAMFAAMGIASTTYIRTWTDFDFVQVAILPMFLASATFFPLSTYPTWARPIVQITPLYHGVDLLRDLSLGTVAWSDLGHIAYMVVGGVFCVRWASRRLGPRLLA